MSDVRGSCDRQACRAIAQRLHAIIDELIGHGSLRASKAKVAMAQDEAMSIMNSMGTAIWTPAVGDSKPGFDCKSYCLGRGCAAKGAKQQGAMHLHGFFGDFEAPSDLLVK